MFTAGTAKHGHAVAFVGQAEALFGRAESPFARLFLNGDSRRYLCMVREPSAASTDTGFLVFASVSAHRFPPVARLSSIKAPSAVRAWGAGDP